MRFSGSGETIRAWSRMYSPAISAHHVSFTSRPSGVISPNPVMTARSLIAQQKPTEQAPWAFKVIVIVRRSLSRRRGCGYFSLVQDRDPMLARVRDSADLRIVTAGLHRPAVVGAPFEAQVQDHLMIHLGLAAVGREVVADHRAVGTGEEDPALQVAQAHLPAPRHLQLFAGQEESRDGDDLQALHRRELFHFAQ